MSGFVGIENRIADFAFEVSFGDFDKTIDWLVSVGCQPTHREESQVGLKGLSGMTVGLMSKLDPITAAVQIAFCLFGTYWVYVCPKLNDVVNKRWTSIRKKGETP